ncbi:hypothetical protein LEMLEM_LOCUS12457 [Lemmus lemmus]
MEIASYKERGWTVLISFALALVQVPWTWFAWCFSNDKLAGIKTELRQRRRVIPSSDCKMCLSKLLLAVPLLAVLGRVYMGLFSGNSLNLLAEDVKRPPEPLVTDKEARKKVLKQGQLEGLWVPRLLTRLLLMQGTDLSAH